MKLLSARDLGQRAPAELRIVTVEADAGRATLLVEWQPPAPPFVPGASGDAAATD